jgi:uroporphyrinogen-III decarboxylase
MTSRKRLLRAIRKEPVDRIPVTLYEFHDYGGSKLDTAPSYKPLVELQKTYGETVVLVSPGEGLLGDQSLHESRPSATHENETETVVHTPEGALRAIVRKEPHIATNWRVKPYIENAEDARRFLSIRSSFTPSKIGELKDLERRLGENGLLNFNIGDPLGRVIGLSNFEHFLLLHQEDPGLVRAMLEKAADFLSCAINFINQHFTDVMVRLYGPEYVGAPLMDPYRFFHPFVGTYDRKLIEIIHAGGNTAVLHCHGRLKDLLDPIGELCADVLEPVEVLPAQTADVTMAEVKDKLGGKMCLAGGLHAVDLDLGTPEVIRRRVQEVVYSGGPRGLIILPTSAPIQTPLPAQILRNYEAMFQSVHELRLDDYGG